MKMRAKRLTRAQKIYITNAGLEPGRYLCLREHDSMLELLNRETGKAEFITKIERRKGK